jgi:hypothetical protein
MQEFEEIVRLPSSQEGVLQEEKKLTPVSLESLIKNAEGLSYVSRSERMRADGESEVYWQAVGSWGRSGAVVEGPTIPDAIKTLLDKPYHLHHELGRKQSIPSQPSDEDLLVRAIAQEKTEEELLEESNINNIKYNWEERQALSLDTSWTVYGGNGKNVHSYHANSLRDAVAKAWVFGKLGIKVLGEDTDNYYLENYVPGLGLKNIAKDHFGHSGLETIVRKEDIHAMLDGRKEKMFQ